MLIARAARLPLDGFQALCRAVHDNRSIIFVTIILGAMVSTASGLVLMQPADFNKIVLAQALRHPPYVLSALAVVAALIALDQIGARQPAGVSVSRPARAVAPVETFDMPAGARPVGRGELLDVIIRRLSAGASTNVYGMPGVGKTCLAAAAVAKLLGPDGRRAGKLFPGGVAWIACETLEAGEAGLTQLAAKVSIALQLELGGSGGAAERLARALQARQRALIVLDGLELGERGLRETDVVRALRVPGKTVLLLTTRRRIETDLGAGGTGQRDDGAFALAPLPEAAAVEMFDRALGEADRARQAGMGHTPGRTRPYRGERQQIAALVRRLGCLPLALELSAKHAGKYGLELAEVQAALERDGIPSAGLSGTDAERTVQACFQRSLRVLTERQQQLFAALALLGGTFPRDAALALARALAGRTQATQPGEPGDMTPPDRDLGALVDIGLLTDLDVRPDPTDADAPMKPRYALHPLLREYAMSIWDGRLPTGGEDALGGHRMEMQMHAGDANLGYWAAFVQSEKDPIRLVREDENLSAAAAWAKAHERSDAAAGYVALGLARARAHTGRVDDAKAQYARVIDLTKHLDDQSGKLLAREAYHYRGLLLYTVAPSDDARSDLEQALRLGRELGDPGAQAADLVNLAQIDVRQAERATGERRTALLAQARDRLRESERLSSQIADAQTQQETRREVMHFLGRVDEAEGDYTSARTHYTQALGLSKAEGNVFCTARDQRHLGYVTALTGDTRQGLRLIREGLATYEADKDLYASGLCYLRLGEIYERKHRRTQARESYELALNRFTEHGATSRAQEAEEGLRRVGPGRKR